MRETRFVRRCEVAVFAAMLAGLFGGACDAGEIVDAADEPEARLDAFPADTTLRLVVSDVNSHFREPTTAVVRSPTEWSELRDQFQVPEEKIAEVDFSEEMVLVAALGTRSTGGFAVAIDSLAAGGGGELKAHVREEEPGAGCVVTQALTSPAVAVAAPRSERAVAFVHQTQVRECG